MKNLRQLLLVACLSAACNVVIAQTNLISNGGFEQGATGFGTDYTYTNTTPEYDGYYMITTNPHLFNGGFCSLANHTTGGSYMMVVDGSEITSQRFWYNSVPVAPFTSYTFSFWSNRLDSYDAPVIEVKINGVSVLVQNLPTTCTWVQGHITWNSGNNTTALIELHSLSSSSIGNDFAIDDISFVKGCQ